MGFLDRRLTANRTAPLRVPVQLPLDAGAGWQTQGKVVTGAVVRDAVVNARAERAESTALRGQQSSFTATFSTKPSTLWAEQSNGHGWTLTLGVLRADGLRAVDWTVSVQVVRSPEGAVAEIDTTEALTSEGALVNGKIHDRVRDRLATRFDGTAQDGWDAEDRISRHSLSPAAHLLAHPVRGHLSAAFDAVTTAPPAEVLAGLERIALPVAKAPPGAPPAARHWHLGLPGSPAGRGYAEVHDEGDRRRVRGGAQVPRTRDEVGDAVAALAADVLFDRVRDLLLRLDPAARWTGPAQPFTSASEG
ncbi:hypothetical protein ABZ915_23645 [Streptomyces sp. NPDC046915]|uniref:hypothetical protein n=1 Tax=Streptomyces sp. NPDC046915 TaxID=3155257 RepID=UPI0033DA1AB6